MNRSHSLRSALGPLVRASSLVAICAPLAAANDPVGGEPESEASEPAPARAEPFASRFAQSPLQGLWDTLADGEVVLSTRLRYEFVDQLPVVVDPLTGAETHSRNGEAYTIRTILGYRTTDWQGFSGYIEFEDVSPIGNDEYNSTTNGETKYAVVADPDIAEINQVYVDWGDEEDGAVRLGRQTIERGNERFIGDHGWRQNQQTYDAISAMGTGQFNWFASYLHHVNGVLGDGSPAGNQPTDSWLADATLHGEGLGDLMLYAYYLDFVDAPFEAMSAFTYGAQFDGTLEIPDRASLPILLEVAWQTDVGDGNDVDASYLHGEIGFGISEIEARVGYEALEGADDPGDSSFSTPLASLHEFNGYADVFNMTPTQGLEDFVISVGGRYENAGGLAWEIAYHEFSAERGGDYYGSEWDLSLTWPIDEHVVVGAKWADYGSGKDIPGVLLDQDVRKLWLWLSASL